MPVERQYFYSRDAVKCSLWLERRPGGSLCPGREESSEHARTDSVRSSSSSGSGSSGSSNRRWAECYRPSWGIIWLVAVVGCCRAGLSDMCDAGRAAGRVRTSVPLPVAVVALFVVLDGLDIVDAAGAASRRSAGGLVCRRVAA